ncbi:MAG: aldolase [Nanoarchaeota archaeon]
MIPMAISEKDVLVPADVPFKMRHKYITNYLEITQRSGRLMLFAGDQKVEHLNDDFFGEGIAPEDNDPEHFFRIASKAKIGCFASQLGLISRYGRDYPNINYLVKLNSKSNLVKTEQREPLSTAWYTVDQVIEFQKDSGLKVPAVGYTLFLGSEFEAEMLHEVAQIIRDAHRNGMVTVIWIYPRGKAVKDERDPHLIAGATGVAACLGTDIVKVNYPKKEGKASAEVFKEAVQAAGRTKVICAGGSKAEPQAFLQELHDQIHVSGASGNATARNIHERPLDEAIRFCNAIYAITVENASVDAAMKTYKG